MNYIKDVYTVHTHHHHFILFCPLYITHRETLTARVNEMLRKNNMDFIANTELYLYGHSSLKHLDNQKILEATIEYIKNTNRPIDLDYASHASLPLYRSVFKLYFCFVWLCVFINIFIIFVVNVVIISKGAWCWMNSFSTPGAHVIFRKRKSLMKNKHFWMNWKNIFFIFC